MSEIAAPVPRVRRAHLAILVLTFAVTRSWAYQAGLRYLTHETSGLWQLLDLDVLHHHLLRGLWNLHSQPPLYNALVGVAEKAGGSHFGEILLCLQLLLGLAAILSVYVAMTELNLAPIFSLIVSLALALNPAAVAFEFDPLYTELVYALHCFMALAIVNYLHSRSTRALYSFACLAVCLTMFRSTYQWVWVVAIFTVLWWQLVRNRPQIRNAAVISVFLSLLWPAKNYVVFHHFTSTTWGPSSMAKHWNNAREQARVNAWYAAGLLPTYAPHGDFALWLEERWGAPAKGAPELDDIRKQTGGAVNWNSLAMLRLHDAQAKDVGFLLRHYPRAYVFNVGRAMWLYFEPSSLYFARVGGEAPANYQRLAALDRIVRCICCNPLGLPPDPVASASQANIPQQEPSFKLFFERVCLGAVLANGLVLACLISFSRRSFWRDRPDRKVAAMVMTATIAYVFVVVNLIEVGESMRFRFETAPLVAMVAAVFLQQVWENRGQVDRRNAVPRPPARHSGAAPEPSVNVTH